MTDAERKLLSRRQMLRQALGDGSYSAFGKGS